LSESTAPLIKPISFGQGDTQYKLGGETVLFRHHKTFVNKNRFAVLFSDELSDEELNEKIENVKKVNYIRIGEEMKVEIAALKYTGNKEAFLTLIQKVKTAGIHLAYMLIL
jgi:acetyl-CoA decarbonylase/synthase complex subunit gamma